MNGASRGNDQMALFWLVGLPAASLGHAVLLVLVLVSRSAAAPVIPPQNVMEVAMVTLHRDADVLPEKVMVAPPVVTGDMGVEEQPPISPDQMVLEQEDADDKEGEDKEPEDDEARRKRRDDLIAQLDRAQLDAPPGPETHLPTDPESDVTDLREVYMHGSGTNVADPELAAYIRDCKDRIMRKWHVLPSVINENPDLEVVVGVRIDDDGRIKESKIMAGSGNRQYDSATLRAVRQMGSLPAPPSDKIMEYARDGIFIRFRASDKVF